MCNNPPCQRINFPAYFDWLLFYLEQGGKDAITKITIFWSYFSTCFYQLKNINIGNIDILVW